MKKKFFLELLFALFFSIFIAFLYIYLPDSYKSMDNKFRDYLFLIRGEISQSDVVTIVDIDEKSLQELGQWPWQRYKVAQILNNLTESGAGVIGLDIVFAEPDNSSPKKVLDEINVSIDGVVDYDDILAESVANSPTILGYVFNMSDDGLKSERNPQIPAIFIERGRSGEQEFLLKPHRAVLNIPKIQNNSYSSGFFNTIPDDDSGIIRSVPLVMKYEDIIYPSLAFEMLRVANEVQKVHINYEDGIGVSSISLGESNIPTDRYGRIFVNYRGDGKTFKYISASDIYHNNFNKQDVEGRFILFGTSAAGLLDLRATPFDNVFPGVEIHANVIDNVMKGDFISKTSWIYGADLVIIMAIGLTLAIVLSLLGAITASIVAISIFSGFLYFNYFMLFEHGLTFNILFPVVTILAIFLSTMIISYFFETKQKELIKAKFANKVSPAVVEDILKHGTDKILEGKEREVTIFFSDIRGFTTLSEAMGSPKKLIELLNEYMTPMTDIIMKSGGTVDKFIGDAIMAYWNAPNDVKNHQDAAVSASLNQIRALVDINKKLRAENKPEIHIGIGLNTGVVTVGEMGSAGRADYTIIGDPVNLASRTEGLNKPYGTQIIVTEFTKAGLKDKYLIRELDLVRVKGKLEPVAIFEVIDFGDGTEEQKAEIAKYNEALMLYRNSKFAEAKVIFEELAKVSTHHLYETYIDRCLHYIENPPENFDGVFTFTTK